MRLELPYPPSVNSIYRHVGPVYLKQEVKAFRGVVAQLVALRPGRTVTLFDRLKVTVTLHHNEQRARDVDNAAKALLDALEHAGVYGNDAQVDELHIVRGASAARPYCTVDVEPIAPEDISP